MSRGKHLSLEEARRLGKLDQYAEEHPMEGKKGLFDKTLKRMASGKKPSAKGKAGEASGAGSSGTRSRGGK